MKNFMDDNFLLKNEAAISLYHQYAKAMPIIDYHCHLNPQEIYENKSYTNITEVWLCGDHYKWRAMRSNGIDEKYITGDAADDEKFMAWARTVPMTIGNPLYHWTHLELRRFFGIQEVLNENTAPVIWGKVKQLFAGPGFRARDLIAKSNVKLLCTTDDPTDTLEYHLKLQQEQDFTVKVLPAFRPDKGIEINKAPFISWINKLAQISEIPIQSYQDLLAALVARVEFFHAVGCRLADHALDYVPYGEATTAEVAEIFSKALQGQSVSMEDENKYKTALLQFFGRLYAKLGWTMQLHIGAMRNNNSKMVATLGPDTGFDSTNDYSIAYPLARLLDSLEIENSLPKTILYTLHPKDNYVLATMLGNFQGGGIPGKIQFGSAWWFNDNLDGMIEQMKALANTGLLSRFVGMLTDSRSFLSYTRHEYFRRIICNLIGEWVENGEVPADMEMLGKIVQGICFNNAKGYFGIDL